ncbi:hypothetical protein BP5796_01781 [Coleophoma crateriformis]|uniref:Rhodopsin domain-containing protein n=1 Tax=Coleophoma crateriformis TaxID=565419 RepID=A0A3D8T1D3_9HELO|nr:hypothetical protein BP5796_01781 [Coleophoma crateriformis]
MSQDVPSRSTAVLVVTTVTLVIASIFVLARLVSRCFIVRRVTLDDYFMIFAWIVAFGLSFSIDFGTSKGLGKHDADILPEWFAPLRRSEYTFSVLYNVALMLTKTSILIFYLRLSQNTNKLLRIASHITLGVVVTAGLVLTCLNVFQCTPVGAGFDPSIKDAKCISIVTLYLASSPVNIITDLAILVLPIPVLTAMRLPQRQKTILIFTFALGIFVVIVDIIRIYYLQQSVIDVSLDEVQTSTQDSRIGSARDFAWYASLSLMWSAVEVNIGIICANVPTLKPLIRKVLPSMLTDGLDSSEKESSFASQTGYEIERAKKIRLDSTEPEDRAPDDTTDAIRPLPPAKLGGPPAREMDLMDFLTDDNPGLARTQTALTMATENTVYFGFVNMKRPKSMLKTRGMESFKYCITVTILFFLWGFSYGLLNTLNSQISKLAHNSDGQTLGLEVIYFGAYLCGPLTVGQWVLRRGGFKATFMTGLSIYGVGTLMFWPSAVLISYPGFVLSTFVVGFGLSVTETAANPFLALCGHERYSESRLLAAQGVQAVGSVLSQLLAQKVLFDQVRGSALIDVQWAYLAIAMFTVILSLFLYYMPLPEASDQDLARLSEDLEIYQTRNFIPRCPVIFTTLGLAVFAQFAYVGAQQSVSYYFTPLLTSLSDSSNNPLKLSTNNYVTLSLSTFAASRFIAAGLCLFMSPRLILFFIQIAAIIFTALTMTISSNPNVIIGPALMLFFFEGPFFPLIFAIGLRGLGKHTKMGAALLTAGASGGGLWPAVSYAVQHVSMQTVQQSLSVVVALFAFGFIFPVYLNFSSQARHQVDPRKRARVDDHDRIDSLTPIRRLSKQFASIVHKSGHKRTSSELPTIEHREATTSWLSDTDEP